MFLVGTRGVILVERRRVPTAIGTLLAHLLCYKVLWASRNVSLLMLLLLYLSGHAGCNPAEENRIP